mmetsp:Transcript_15035/g.31544  ORF Transcript_15035/g.31544 Transcript_15035/m.31544 type:complete len:80 (-) Transcript_15035:975-1214(-)
MHGGGRRDVNESSGQKYLDVVKTKTQMQNERVLSSIDSTFSRHSNLTQDHMENESEHVSFIKRQYWWRHQDPRSSVFVG